MLRSVVLIDVDYKATILPSAFTHAQSLLGLRSAPQ
jgi:hypothetical protein